MTSLSLFQAGARESLEMRLKSWRMAAQADKRLLVFAMASKFTPGFVSGPIYARDAIAPPTFCVLQATESWRVGPGYEARVRYTRMGRELSC